MRQFKFSRLTLCVKLSYLAILSDTILWPLPLSHSADAAKGRRLANQTPVSLSVVCSAEETREELGRNGEISSRCLFLRVHHSALFNPPLLHISSPQRVDAVPSQAEVSSARCRFLLSSLHSALTLPSLFSYLFDFVPV